MGFFSDLGSAISSAFSGGSSRTSRSSSASGSSSSSDSDRSSRHRSSRSTNSFAQSQASLRSFGARVMDFFSNAFKSVSPERREDIDDYVENNANKRSVIDHKGGTVIGQALIGNSSLGTLTFAEQTYMSSKAVSVWEASENEEAIEEAAHEVREDRSARAALSGALSHSAAENARKGQAVSDFQKTMLGHATDLDASVVARSFNSVEAVLGEIAGTHFTNTQQMALLNVASSQVLSPQSTTSLVASILSETSPDELEDESLRQSMSRAIATARIPGIDIRATSSQTLLAAQLDRALATTGGRSLLVGGALGKDLFDWDVPELTNFLDITTPGLERLDEGGFKLRAQEYAVGFVGYRHGQAQAIAAFGGDIIGGIANGAEAIFEGAVVGLENTALGLLISDAYAEKQMNDLKERGAALVDGIKSIPDMPAAFVEKYEADFELADTLELAYQTGRADLSVLQEANRIRGRATAELGIIAAETAATVVGVGAATKAIRAGKMLDTDTLNPAALANLSRDVTRATTADVKAFISDTSGSVPLSLDAINDAKAVRSANAARRYEPGTVSGTGQLVGADWMRQGVQNGGAPVPSQIAEKLAGREFSTFDEFREAFWQEVAADPGLAGQFNLSNQSRISKGLAPRAPVAETVGGRRSFELDHIDPLFRGGEVYDTTNIQVMTPEAHIEKTKND